MWGPREKYGIFIKHHIVIEEKLSGVLVIEYVTFNPHIFTTTNKGTLLSVGVKLVSILLGDMGIG